MMKIFSGSSFAVSANNKSPQMLKRDAPTCYNPNGSVSPIMFACDILTVFSPCCMFGTVCLDNKLCRNDNDIYRGGCTDPTWNSSDCPRMCLGK